MITLITKDGSKIGNAIIYGGCHPQFPESRGDFGQSFDMDPVFFVETDFGNHFKLTWREIEDMFVVGRVMSHQEWRQERQQLFEQPNLIELSMDPTHTMSFKP